MKKIILCIVVLIVMLSSASADDHWNSYEFDLSELGFSPTNQMQCVRGACSSDPNQHNFMVASYTRLTDPLSFCGYVITQPQYDFYQDELFRVRFKLNATETDPESCLEIIEQELVARYQMTCVSEYEDRYDDTRSTLKLVFQSDAGVVAQIVWKKFGHCWGTPYVKLQKTELINALNKTMNPQYISKSY
ncbi:MAG: hypothetical protein J7K75_03870 [Desulfuromonas sp.]|nr:hypothetical protein [Desulfuromonas sp.]